MRLVLAIATAVGVIVLGLVATGGPAGASVFPGTNGKIEFAEDPAPDSFTINPDGSNVRHIGPSGTACEGWAPDGSKLVCNLISSGGTSHPATVNPDGSDLTVLPKVPEAFCDAWSPA